MKRACKFMVNNKTYHIRGKKVNVIHMSLSVGFDKATLLGSLNEAHSIHFPGATCRTLRTFTSTATSVIAILILCNIHINYNHRESSCRKRMKRSILAENVKK